MSIILHEERDACGLTLIVNADPYPVNPRAEFEQLGTLVCWHRRYALGDKHDWPSPEEFEAVMEERSYIRLPVFMYDHSGITIATTPFSCSWDSCQIGWIFVEWIKLRAAFPKLRRRADLEAEGKRVLRAEIAELDQYLTGDVWCARIETPDGNVRDSCCGFFCGRYAIEEGRRMLADCAEDFRREQVEAFVEMVEAERPDLVSPD